jgi:ABC-2 type transport system ATP-binding protein
MISIAHVRKAFGSVVALDGVCLELQLGERVAFVGANGSGKTTLLRALLGLVRFEGRIAIGGADVAREPEAALRNVAYIPQIAPPIDAPVREVVRAHAAIRGIREDDTYARAARLGLDLGASRQKKFRELSGGMKQKCLAAMALASGAPVLVCDEPTANLDHEARAGFFAQLGERPSGGILVLCSHRAEEVRQLVRRVVELNNGRVVRDGPMQRPSGAAYSEETAPSETRPLLRIVRGS